MQDDEPKPWAIRCDGDWPRVQARYARVAVVDGKLECGLRQLPRDNHATRHHCQRGEPESRRDKQMPCAGQRRYHDTGEDVGDKSRE